MEVSNNNELRFLDTMIILKDNHLKTKWTKKEICSTRILSFLSNHPFQHKYNVLSNLMRRAIRVTDEEYLNDTRKTVFNIAQMNCYPIKLIKRAWYQNLNSERDKIPKKKEEMPDVNHKPMISDNVPTTSNNKQRRTTDFFKMDCELSGNETNIDNGEQKINKQKGFSGAVKKPLNSHKFAGLTYIRGLSNKIIRDLKEYHLGDIKIAHKPVNKLGRIYSNLKDKIGKMDKKDVIYKLNCKDCESSYIGHTGQLVSQRMQNHKYTCRPGSKNKTAPLSDHAKNSNHSFQLDQPELLYTVPNKFKRQVVENICITKNISKGVNYKTDIGVVGSFYSAVIDKLTISNITGTSPNVNVANTTTTQ